MAATACKIYKNGDIRIFDVKKQKFVLIKAKKDKKRR